MKKIFLMLFAVLCAAVAAYAMAVEYPVNGCHRGHAEHTQQCGHKIHFE